MGLTLGWMSCKHWIKTSSVPRLSELQQQNSTVNTHSSCWAKFANYNFCANPLADTSRSAHRRIADHQNIRGAVLADGGMQTFMVWQSADDRPNGLNLYILSLLYQRFSEFLEDRIQIMVYIWTIFRPSFIKRWQEAMKEKHYIMYSMLLIRPYWCPGR